VDLVFWVDKTYLTPNFANLDSDSVLLAFNRSCLFFFLMLEMQCFYENCKKIDNFDEPT